MQKPFKVKYLCKSEIVLMFEIEKNTYSLIMYYIVYCNIEIMFLNLYVENGRGKKNKTLFENRKTFVLRKRRLIDIVKGF